MNDDLSIVRRFLTLSEEYSNRPIVARRGTLPTLLRYLRSEASRDVRFAAATTLGLLAAHPDNPDLMCREPGLVDALYEAYNESQATDPELHAAIATAFSALQPALQDDDNGTGEGGRDGPGGAEFGLDDFVANIKDGESARTVKNRRTRIRQSGARYHAVVLRIANLGTPGDRAEVEEVLQTTRGVVSYTINEYERAATVQLTTSTALLVKLLSDAGFTCDVVSDVEIERRGGGTPPAAEAAYLNEDDLWAGGGGNASGFRQSLVLHGVEHNTLSARLRRQKEERQKPHSGARSAVTNFIGKLTAGWW